MQEARPRAGRNEQPFRFQKIKEYPAMISFTVRMTFSPDDRSEVAEILRALTEASRMEPGCISYIPHYVDSDRDTVLIYEQYRDAAAAEAHRQSAHFKKYAVGGLYQKMRDRVREDLVALA
jgi:quinol monooxygenase YgiN